MLRTRTSGDAAQLLVDEAEDWTEDEPAVGLRAVESRREHDLPHHGGVLPELRFATGPGSTSGPATEELARMEGTYYAV